MGERIAAAAVQIVRRPGRNLVFFQDFTGIRGVEVELNAGLTGSDAGGVLSAHDSWLAKQGLVEAAVPPFTPMIAKGTSPGSDWPHWGQDTSTPLRGSDPPDSAATAKPRPVATTAKSPANTTATRRAAGAIIISTYQRRPIADSPSSWMTPQQIASMHGDGPKASCKLTAG